MAEKKPLGLLILHGFTGSLDTVRALVPRAEAQGWPWRMPVLRGHGTRYEDLADVRWQDWVADAEAALGELLAECDRVVIAGLSMGALAAIHLGLKHPGQIAGLVLLAPALRFRDPLTPLTPILKLLFPFWDNPSSFADPACAKACTNYTKFPTAAFSRLLDFASETERRLPELTVPVVAIFARQDRTVHGIVPKLLESRLTAPLRLVWFEKSGHEMLQDCEADAIADAALEAAQGFMAARAEA